MDETLNDNGVTTLTAAELFGDKPSEKPEAEASAEAETTETSEAQESKAEGENENGSEETEAQDEPSESDEPGDESESDDDATDESESESDEGKKKAKGAERRIKKLVQKNKELAESKDREIEFLKSLLKKDGKLDDPKTQTKPDVSELKPPNPDDFEDHEEYQAKREEYLLAKAEENALKKFEQKQAEKEQLAQKEAFNQKMSEFKNTHDDFDDVLGGVGDVNFTDGIRDAIFGSDLGLELAYQLAKKPAEFKRICSLPDGQAIKEIAKVELSLSKPPAQKKTEVKKTTQAPPPPKPVGSTSEGKKSIYDKDISTLEFWKLREEEEAQKRKTFF